MYRILTYLLCFSISTFASARIYPSLKVLGDYKVVPVLIEPPPRNNLKLSYSDIERSVKLKLLGSGLKVSPTWKGIKHLLVISITPLDQGDGSMLSIDVNLQKFSKEYNVDQSVAGTAFTPEQGTYSCVGYTENKSSALTWLNEKLEEFLIDYLESNTDDKVTIEQLREELLQKFRDGEITKEQYFEKSKSLIKQHYLNPVD
jgi:hypothetical protein